MPESLPAVMAVVAVLYLTLAVFWNMRTAERLRDRQRRACAFAPVWDLYGDRS